MMDWRARTALFAAALWWGGATAIGFIAVPMLFAWLPTPALAGGMAARLFTAETWLALGCGLVLLMARPRWDGEGAPPRMDGALAFVLAGMLLALLSEFAIAPRIVARQNLALWHSLGSAMYALQWVCAGVVVWKRGFDKPVLSSVEGLSPNGNHHSP